MKKISILLLAAMPLMFLTSCNPGTNEDQTAERAEDLNEDIKTAYAEEDAELVVELYSYHLMLQEYGEVAKTKESTPDPVKHYADSAVNFYQKLNDELKRIATANKIVLPEVVGENVREHKKSLTEKEGAEFADDYIETVDDIQTKMIAKYQEAVVEAVDPNLKSWVGMILPIMREREEMVNQLEDYTSKIE